MRDTLLLVARDIPLATLIGSLGQGAFSYASRSSYRSGYGGTGDRCNVPVPIGEPGGDTVLTAETTSMPCQRKRVS